MNNQTVELFSQAIFYIEKLVSEGKHLDEEKDLDEMHRAASYDEKDGACGGINYADGDLASLHQNDRCFELNESYQKGDKF